MSHAPSATPSQHRPHTEGAALSFYRSPDVHTALLVAVVGACGPVVEALIDEMARELGELLLAHLVTEALLHSHNGLLARAKARQLAADADEGGTHR